MSLEVAFVANTGVPDDAIISVRAGGVRKQATMSAMKSFSFRSGEFKENRLKFDVFQRIGGGNVVLKPAAANASKQYKVALSPSMSCEVNITSDAPESNEKESAEDSHIKAMTSSSAKDAKEYLEKTGALSFLQSVLHVVIKEKPENPYDLMGSFFLNGYEAPTTIAKPVPANVPKEEVAPPIEEKTTVCEKQDGNCEQPNHLQGTTVSGKGHENDAPAVKAEVPPSNSTQPADQEKEIAAEPGPVLVSSQEKPPGEVNVSNMVECKNEDVQKPCDGDAKPVSQPECRQMNVGQGDSAKNHADVRHQDLNYVADPYKVPMVMHYPIMDAAMATLNLPTMNLLFI